MVVLAAMALVACGEEGPTQPAEGGLDFEVVDSGTALADGDFESGLLVARTSAEGEAVAERSPVAVTGERFRAWEGYDDSALIGAFVIELPDPGHTLEVQEVEVTGDLLRVTGRINSRGGVSAQVIANAWALLSLDSSHVRDVTRCELQIEGRPPAPATACQDLASLK